MAKAETDPKVMSMVERELKKNAAVSVEELQKKAARINKGVSSLTARQFHARYPLQIKRRKAGGTPTPKATKKATPRRTRRTSRKRTVAATPAPVVADAGVDRDAIRTAFLSFASELAAAEARKDVVKVLAGVDKYVDRVAKASGS